MAQPYAAYPPGAYYGSGYDYSSYYASHQQHYDPNQAYWAQHYQQQQYGAAPQAPQAPHPPQASPPPLPADDPPPLPPDDAAAPAGQAGAQAPANAASGQDSAATKAATGAVQAQQQQATQVATGGSAAGGAANATGSHYSAVPHAAQYPAYAPPYGGYYGQAPGYGAPPPYGATTPGYGAPPGYGYPYGPHDPSANPSYVPQANTPYPPSAPPPGAGQSPMPAANTDNRTTRWNRAPPPASLAAPGGTGNGRPAVIKPATIVGGSPAVAGTAPSAAAVAAGGALNGLDAAKLSAAISAATAAAAAAQTAAAASSIASPLQQQQQHHQQQQFIAVGAAQVAAPAAASTRPDLPASFNQYVQRALLRAGSDKGKQDKLRALLLSVIAEHRKAGTMWSTDWDRKPLPELDSPSAPSITVVRSSVFDRMVSPKGQQQQQNSWDRRSRYKDDSKDDEDDWRGHSRDGYRDHRERDRYGSSPSRGSKHRGNKRGWDDDSRYGHSDSDSDDERSDSWGNDGEGYRGRAAAAAAGDSWESYASKKKQQWGDLQAAGGSGRGKGRKQQEGGRGRGRSNEHWSQLEGKKKKKQRVNLQAAGGNDQQPAFGAAAGDLARQAARSARFGAALQMAAYGWEDDGSEAAGGFIVGTCQKLEKRYLRLTRPPLPEEVRPQPVLAAALQRLLGMIATKADKYLYYNDQFKAMRQDLTVQGIKNDFTVQVYEAHARAALEYGDNAEYNQCQAQLAILYARGLPGSHAEFGAYRLLYQSVYANHGEGRKLLGTLRQLLGNRVGEVAHTPEVQHAMQVRQALASGNVLRFFQLYTSAPLLSRRLMDAAVKQLRFKLLSALVRTHKPTVLSLPFLARSLGFVARGQHQQAAPTVDSSGQLLPGCSNQTCVGDNEPCMDEQQALQACLTWCKQHGAEFDQETDLSNSALLTKECWNKLFVPVDTSKVAHGDANLDIRDFLAIN